MPDPAPDSIDKGSASGTTSSRPGSSAVGPPAPGAEPPERWLTSALVGAAKFGGGALADDPAHRRSVAVGGYTRLTAGLSALTGGAGAMTATDRRADQAAT